jgi:hypothetical protein
MTSVLPRRDFLLAGLAAAIAAAGAGGFSAALYAEGAIGAEQFLAFSKALTKAADLDGGIGKTLLGGFLAMGKGAALAQLAGNPANAAAKNPALANAIVAAWCSGVYDTPGGQDVATFDQALLWNALSYTKPFGECGGATGYWAEAPKS